MDRSPSAQGAGGLAADRRLTATCAAAMTAPARIRGYRAAWQRTRL